MNLTQLLLPGSFTRIIAKKPRHLISVSIITGDPSANTRPQDDSRFHPETLQMLPHRPAAF